MKNNEVKNYKGYTIKKESNDSFIVNGFLNKFKSYNNAKIAIDETIAEEKALDEVEEYVQNVCGGWL